MTRVPIKDQIAIVGVGSTGFTRRAGRSQAALALEACTEAIADAGLSKHDIDGVCGTLAPTAPYMVSALGLPEVTFFGNQRPTFVFTIMAAMHAIHAGACDTVLAYNAIYRVPANSRSAAADPFRRHLAFGGVPASKPLRFEPEDLSVTLGYAAWASRYEHEARTRRDQWAYVPMNARTNARLNPLAVMREPLSPEEYAGARMIWEPLSMYDMDVPVDGADAFILTSVERASALTPNPVTIHAATSAIGAPAEEEQIRGLRDHNQRIVVKKLRQSSDLWIDDVDLYYPYDGFSIITLAWLESCGWCGFGEAGDFLEQHWDASANRILIDGRVLVNTHGGALGEGATQGSGHVREAVLQLRGQAGERQHPGAKSALLTVGGMFRNSQGLVLRT